MSDEKKVSAETSGTPTPKRRVWPVVIAAFSVIIIVVFVGVLHLHELPAFCSTICHNTMQEYVDGYNSEDEGLSVAQHAQAGVTCLGCHWSQAKMMDLVHEVILYVTDSYTDPLPDQRDNFVNEEFCGACHDGVTAPTKESATEGWDYDPHNIPEGVTAHEGQDFNCSSCHTVHKQSTMVCATCHVGVEVPDGWATPETATSVSVSSTAEKYGIFDMHAGDTYVQFSVMHETAGSDGGTIQCLDCHETKTIVCGQCHANTFGEDLPEGWSIPEGAIDVSAMAAAAEEDSSDESSDDSASTDAVTAEGAADGEWTGTGTGIGGEFEVTVTIADGAITDVTVGENSETEGIGSNAIEQLPSAIVEANGTEGVDAVSGASVTSAAIFEAVADAISQAKA